MEKINIAELLKDCPKGMELDCVLNDNVTFECILDGNSYPIQIQTPEGNMRLSQYGCMSLSRHAKCVIFPKGKTTWEGFVPPCNFKDGDVITSIFDDICIFKGENAVKGTVDYYCGITSQTNDNQGFFVIKNIKEKPISHFGNISEYRLATEKEKQRIFDVIKENGYKWDKETKTLYKLVEPKFKVGDRIKSKGLNLGIVTITKVCEDHYELDDGCTLKLNGQDYYELVLNKFDINTLIPFESKVLIRDNESQKWYPAIWGFYEPETYFPYKLIGCISNCCIPYEGNERLLGTSDDCDNFYKVWKE